METSQLFQIGLLFGSLLVAIWGYTLAEKRNRKKWLWFFICLFTGLFGLITLAVAKPLEYDEELDCSDTDTLGNVMIWIALAFAAFQAYTTYQQIKAAHDAMMWNFMMSF